MTSKVHLSSGEQLRFKQYISSNNKRTSLHNATQVTEDFHTFNQDTSVLWVIVRQCSLRQYDIHSLQFAPWYFVTLSESKYAFTSFSGSSFKYVHRDLITQALLVCIVSSCGVRTRLTQTSVMAQLRSTVKERKSQTTLFFPPAMSMTMKAIYQYKRWRW